MTPEERAELFPDTINQIAVGKDGLKVVAEYVRVDLHEGVVNGLKKDLAYARREAVNEAAAKLANAL